MEGRKKIVEGGMIMYPNPNLENAVDKLKIWWSSEPQSFRALVFSLLAALPGGDELNAVPAPIGWVEAAMLGELLRSLNDKDDVKYVIRELMTCD